MTEQPASADIADIVDIVVTAETPESPDPSAPNQQATLVVLLDRSDNPEPVMDSLRRSTRGTNAPGLDVHLVLVLRAVYSAVVTRAHERAGQDSRFAVVEVPLEADDAFAWTAGFGLVSTPLVAFVRGVSTSVGGHWVPDLFAPLADPQVCLAEPSLRVTSQRNRSAPIPRPDGAVLAARTADVLACGGLGSGLSDLARRLRLHTGGWYATADLNVPIRRFALTPRPGSAPTVTLTTPVDPARLTWSIWTAVPYGRARRTWGDWHFATDLAQALRRRGQSVSVDHVESTHRVATGATDVVLALRGLQRFAPPPSAAVSLLWIISHPDAVTDAELQAWDLVYAASRPWSALATERSGREVRPLLQCTDATAFHPDGERREPGEPVLFVAGARGLRPIARDAVAAGVDLAVYGAGWDDLLPAGVWRADHVDNNELPAAYRSAHVVLADHADAMRHNGFLANRLFDAAACGARVISDDIEGLDEVFGGLVRAYDTPQTLAALAATDEGWPPPVEARALSDRVAAEHSFDARADELLTVVTARIGDSVPG